MLMEILGWVGSIALIAAYGLNSYQKIKSDSWLYYFLNFSAGLLLILYSVYKEAYANVFINVVWVVLIIPPILRLLLNKK